VALELDHVVICVPDLDEARRTFEAEYGVTTVEGGRHTGHGTANELIPLGDCYLELVTVVSPKEALTSPWGAWTLHRAAVPGADAICFRTNALDEVSARLDLQTTDMQRVTPDGVILQWRLAGLKQALSAGLPFFIQWDIPLDLHPGRAAVEHPAGRVEMTEVLVSGDLAALEEWAPPPPGVSYVAGEPEVSFRLDGHRHL
jgi:hypothetical protein